MSKERDKKVAYLKEYIRSMAVMGGKAAKHNGFKYTSLHDFYLGEGHIYPNTPLTSDEDRLWSIMKGYLFRQRECFSNATRIITNNKLLDPHRVYYAEGMGFGRAIIPVDHAFISINGKPVDVTWFADGERKKKNSRSRKRIMARVRENLEKAVYFGLDIPFEYVNKHILNTMTYSSVIEGKQWSYPWVKTGLPWRSYESTTS